MKKLIKKKNVKRKKATGIKHDQEKPPYDLLPYEALDEIAKVLGFGGKKYSRGQWSGGIIHSRLISAAMRHINQHNSGEDKDPESGLLHIAHAATNLMFLLWMIKHRPELDDRWVKEKK